MIPPGPSTLPTVPLRIEDKVIIEGQRRAAKLNRVTPCQSPLVRLYSRTYRYSRRDTGSDKDRGSSLRSVGSLTT